MGRNSYFWPWLQVIYWGNRAAHTRWFWGFANVHGRYHLDLGAITLAWSLSPAPVWAAPYLLAAALYVAGIWGVWAWR